MGKRKENDLLDSRQIGISPEGAKVDAADAARIEVGRMVESGRSSPLANFVWLTAERGWRVLLGLGVNVAVARHLGPGDFGRLNYALGLTAICWTLGGLGIDDVLARELVRNRQKAPALFAAGLRLKAAGALVAFALLLAAAGWSAGDGSVVVLAGAALFFLPLDSVDVWFQAREKMRPPVLARQSALLAATLLRLLLVGMKAPLWAFAVAYMCEALLIALALGCLFVRDAGWPDWKGVRGIRARELLAEGWPLLASGAAVIVSLQADRLLLRWLAGEAAVGVYSAAARFTEALYVLPVAVGTVLLPRLTALRQSDEAAYWRTAARTGWLLFGAAGILSAALSLGGYVLLPRLLGASYTASGGVLAIHGWCLVFIALESLRSRLLIIEGRSRWVLAMAAATTVLNLLVSLWLIPRWGAAGAAWANVGAWACSALLMPWLWPGPRSFMRAWCGLANRA
jgi:PST family polysaccharide transporter